MATHQQPFHRHSCCSAPHYRRSRRSTRSRTNLTRHLDAELSAQRRVERQVVVSAADKRRVQFHRCSRRSPQRRAAASPFTHSSCITGQAILLDLHDASMQLFRTCQQQPHVCTQEHMQVHVPPQHAHIACALYPSVAMLHA